MIINSNNIRTITTDYYIIDDSKYIGITQFQKELLMELKNVIYQRKELLVIENLSSIAMDLHNSVTSIKNYEQNDLFIAVGTGGKLIGTILQSFASNIIVYNVDFKRYWNEDKTGGFCFDFNNLDIDNKNVILLDDVIVTGTSIKIAIKELKKHNCKVLGSLVGITNKAFIQSNFEHDVVVARVICDAKKSHVGLDPLWYPAIFSVRHILNQENGMDNFAKAMVDKYFDGELEVYKLFLQLEGKGSCQDFFAN